VDRKAGRRPPAPSGARASGRTAAKGRPQRSSLRPRPLSGRKIHRDGGIPDSRPGLPLRDGGIPDSRPRFCLFQRPQTWYSTISMSGPACEVWYSTISIRSSSAGETKQASILRGLGWVVLSGPGSAMLGGCRWPPEVLARFVVGDGARVAGWCEVPGPVVLSGSRRIGSLTSGYATGERAKDLSRGRASANN
jgi:hypothetical protein